MTSGEAFKSAITHDVLHVNIKMKEPVDIRFNGLIIECVNEMPKFQDKSQSMYRRLLPIPSTRGLKDASESISRPIIFIEKKCLSMCYGKC